MQRQLHLSVVLVIGLCVFAALVATATSAQEGHPAWSGGLEAADLASIEPSAACW